MAIQNILFIQSGLLSVNFSFFKKSKAVLGAPTEQAAGHPTPITFLLYQVIPAPWPSPSFPTKDNSA